MVLRVDSQWNNSAVNVYLKCQISSVPNSIPSQQVARLRLIASRRDWWNVWLLCKGCIPTSRKAFPGFPFAAKTRKTENEWAVVCVHKGRNNRYQKKYTCTESLWLRTYPSQILVFSLTQCVYMQKRCTKYVCLVSSTFVLNTQSRFRMRCLHVWQKCSQNPNNIAVSEVSKSENS